MKWEPPCHLGVLERSSLLYESDAEFLNLHLLGPLAQNFHQPVVLLVAPDFHGDVKFLSKPHEEQQKGLNNISDFDEHKWNLDKFERKPKQGGRRPRLSLHCAEQNIRCSMQKKSRVVQNKT